MYLYTDFFVMDEIKLISYGIGKKELLKIKMINAVEESWLKALEI